MFDYDSINILNIINLTIENSCLTNIFNFKNPQLVTLNNIIISNAVILNHFLFNIEG